MGNSPQKMIIDIDRDFVAVLREGLKKHGKVKVTGLGIFEVRKVKARIGFNPSSKEKEMIKEYKKIKFTATKILKDLLQ